MFKLIVARDINHGIGFENKIQWRDKDDLNFFRTKTLNNVVIMGRKTFESIGKPLPNRVNIILSKTYNSQDTYYENTYIFCDLDKSIDYVKKKFPDKEWWVIGGLSIYDEFISRRLVLEVFISEINNIYLSDTVFNYFSGCDNNLYTNKFILHDKYKLSENVLVKHYKYNNNEEIKLLDTMKDIIENGFYKTNRTGVNTYSLFGKMFEYYIDSININDNGINRQLYSIPLLTTKKMFLRGIFEELKWFLNGGTNSKYLESKKINIWKGNTTREYLDNNNLKEYDEGECGPIYGFQWRHWGATYIQGKTNYENEGIDQVSNVINSLKHNPFSRRHIISGWNVSDLDKMCLPPCFIKNTNVLTNNGYKFIQDINENDKLFTHKGTFKNIINIQKKHYNDIIYKINHSSNHKHIHATKEHPFLVSELHQINNNSKKFILSEPKWIEAKDLNTDIHYLCIPKNQNRQYPSMSIVLNNKEVYKNYIVANYTYYLLGIYLIKGFCIKSDNTIISPEWTLFSEFDSDDCKACKIPYWVYDLPKECLIEFLKGCSHTINDSVKTKEGKIFIKCKYENVALGLQILFAKIDIHIQIHLQKDFSFILSEVDMSEYNFVNTNYCYYKINSIDTYNYNDNVYNFEVETDNSYTVENIAVHNCHVLYQFLVHENENKKYLTLMMTQRSCDTFLGLPFNIASLGLFLISIAQEVNMIPYKIIHSIADMHIYENHINEAKLQISRTPYSFPYIYIPKSNNILENVNYEDIKLYYYNSYSSIKGKMSA